MSRLGNANKRAKVVRALRRAGFRIHAGGKHAIVTDAEGNLVAVLPNAREFNVHTLRAILKQCGLSEDDYLRWY